MHVSLDLQRFTVPFTNDISGILVREDETAYEIVSPLSFSWLQHLQKETWLPFLSTQKIPKQWTRMRDVQATYEFADWVFDFPIKEADLPVFPAICSFFQDLLTYQKQVDVQLLERVISDWDSFLPSYVLHQLITFTVTHEAHRKERIRFLLSPSIQMHMIS